GTRREWRRRRRWDQRWRCGRDDRRRGRGRRGLSSLGMRAPPRTRTRNFLLVLDGSRGHWSRRLLIGRDELGTPGRSTALRVGCLRSSRNVQWGWQRRQRWFRRERRNGRLLR